MASGGGTGGANACLEWHSCRLADARRRDNGISSINDTWIQWRTHTTLCHVSEYDRRGTSQLFSSSHPLPQDSRQDVSVSPVKLSMSTKCTHFVPSFCKKVKQKKIRVCVLRCHVCAGFFHFFMKKVSQWSSCAQLPPRFLREAPHHVCMHAVCLSLECVTCSSCRRNTRIQDQLKLSLQVMKLLSNVSGCDCACNVLVVWLTAKLTILKRSLHFFWKLCSNTSTSQHKTFHCDFSIQNHQNVCVRPADMKTVGVSSLVL